MAVWVANRNNPILDIDGSIKIDVHGNLSILSSGNTVLDLFSPTLVTRNTSVTLLDSRNLVLQELYQDGSVKEVLWQSFDYPTDTLLPGMKLGINLKTRHRWSLTSWLSDTSPWVFYINRRPQWYRSTSHSHARKRPLDKWTLAEWTDYYFASRNDYVYGDEYVYDESYNLSLYDCKKICWSNCSCMACTYATENKAGCKIYSQMIYDPAKSRHHPYTEYGDINYREGQKKDREQEQDDNTLDCVDLCDCNFSPTPIMPFDIQEAILS
ncbi:G-type lectin S-receptor-like serine/threonine-protein kinase CES101 [Tanacetum coccineum]